MRWCCHVWGICFHQTLINLAADYVLHGEISLRDFPCTIERPLAAEWWLTVQTNSWPPTSDSLDSILIFRYGKQICTFNINVLLKVKNIFSYWEGDVFYTADISPECSKGGVNEGYLKRLALKNVWGWQSFAFQAFLENVPQALFTQLYSTSTKQHNGSWFSSPGANLCFSSTCVRYLKYLSMYFHL